MFGTLGAVNRLKSTDPVARKWAMDETKAFARRKLAEQLEEAAKGTPGAKKRVEVIQRAIELLDALKV